MRPCICLENLSYTTFAKVNRLSGKPNRTRALLVIQRQELTGTHLTVQTQKRINNSHFGRGPKGFGACVSCRYATPLTHLCIDGTGRRML
jgi:hypothetical protein